MTSATTVVILAIGVITVKKQCATGVIQHGQLSNLRGYHHNSECPQNGKAANKRGGGFVNLQQLLCSNCQGAGHIRIDCIKPICSACGTIWRTRQNPGYHHCDQCPHPSKQDSNFGKRSNPTLAPESRAHMSMMKQCLIEEEIEHPIDASDWSDEDLGDVQTWKRPHL